VYQRLVADGTLPGGFAGDDGVAFHFVDGALVEAVGSRAEAGGYQVEAVDGRPVERRLPTRVLAS
jgi:hypothetical protein